MEADEIPEEIQAKIVSSIMENKPYLIEIEEAVQKLGYGTIDLKLDIRAGVVEKISFYKTQTWLKDHPKQTTVVETKFDISTK